MSVIREHMATTQKRSFALGGESMSATLDRLCRDSATAIHAQAESFGYGWQVLRNI